MSLTQSHQCPTALFTALPAPRIHVDQIEMSTTETGLADTICGFKRMIGALGVVSAIFVLAGCGGGSLGATDTSRPHITRVKPMVNNRTGHTATLVSDSAANKSILFVGGGGSACNRELYKLGDGSKTMEFGSICRIDHTATRLDDGTVLIAVGQNSLQMASETLASAEIYSQETNTFPLTGDLITARYGHAALLLSDGKVLLAGVFVTDAQEKKVPIASAEPYDPQSRSFSPLPELAFPRAGHSLTLLDDGSVLVIGGTTAELPIELYLPAERRFVALAGTNLARSGHTSNRLEDCTVLIAGGIDHTGATLADAVLFDPESAQIETAGLLNVSPHSTPLINYLTEFQNQTMIPSLCLVGLRASILPAYELLGLMKDIVVCQAPSLPVQREAGYAC